MSASVVAATIAVTLLMGNAEGMKESVWIMLGKCPPINVELEKECDVKECISKACITTPDTSDKVKIESMRDDWEKQPVPKREPHYMLFEPQYVISDQPTTLRIEGWWFKLQL